MSILQLGEGRRLDGRLAVDGVDHFVQILPVSFFESRFVDLAHFGDGGFSFQAIGKSRQQLSRGLCSEFFSHVLHIQLALTIGHVPI